MSYILDALKKADQKRKLGSVPDVHTVHEPVQVNMVKRLHWPYLLAVVLMINATIIIWWLQPWGKKEPAPSMVKDEIAQVNIPTAEQRKRALSSLPDKREVPQKTIGRDVGQGVQKKVAGQPVYQTKRTIKNRQGQVERSPVAPPPSPIVTRSATPSSLPQVAVKPQPPVKEQVPVKEETLEAVLPLITDESLPNISVSKSASVHKRPLPSKPDPLISQQKPRTVGPALSEISSTRDSFTDEDISKEMETETEKDKEKKELARIPYLYQLPDNIQRIIPEVRISFHSYSSRKSSRLVSINGKIVREGQEIAGGIKLEKITAEGVVLKYQSRRFKIDV